MGIHFDFYLVGKTHATGDLCKNHRQSGFILFESFF